MSNPSFRLVRKAALSPNTAIEIQHEGVERIEEVPAIEIQPGTKKYMVSVEVGDLSPSDARTLMQHSAKLLREFLGDKNVLVVPARNGHPAIGIYELEPVEDNVVPETP